jgi:hypothetical protein
MIIFPSHSTAGLLLRRNTIRISRGARPAEPKLRMCVEPLQSCVQVHGYHHLTYGIVLECLRNVKFPKIDPKTEETDEMW